jgi:hypothetical protein
MAVLHSFNSPVENMNLLLGQLMAISIPQRGPEASIGGLPEKVEDLLSRRLAHAALGRLAPQAVDDGAPGSPPGGLSMLYVSLIHTWRDLWRGFAQYR